MSEAFLRPPDWDELPLAEIATYETGRTPARANAEYWTNDQTRGTPWVSIGDMTPFGILKQTAEHISENAIRQVFRNRKVRAGTLLMSFKLTIGRVATLGVDACHNEAIISIYPNPRVKQKYLEYFLSQVDYSEYQDRAVKGNTLNQEKIDRIAVTLPPKREQEKIAAVLWKVQKAIEIQDNLVRAAREFKAAAMRKLFISGLRNEALRETDIGPVPESWEVWPIRDKAKLVAGGTPARSVPEYWRGGTIPWVKTGEVDYCLISATDEKITEAGLANSAAKILPVGTLLVAMYGQGVTRGKAALLGIPAATNQACAAIILNDTEVNSEFLYYYLSYSYERLRSFSHGAQQQNLNADLVGAFAFPKPSLEEQREIVRILRTLDRKIEHHERKRAVLNDLFRTLLSKLMTGQIRIGKLDIDTSEVAAC